MMEILTEDCIESLQAVVIVNEKIEEHFKQHFSLDRVLWKRFFEEAEEQIYRMKNASNG